MLDSLDISTSALVAQRVRLDVITGNIANAFTTEQEDGTPIPYRRRFVTFAPNAADGGLGVHVQRVQEDPADFQLRYDPTHPNRIRRGPDKDWVQYPNVNITMEYVDALSASRAYEANIAAIEVTKSMMSATLRLLA